MGQVPDRSSLRGKGMEGYLQLTLAVRNGDLRQFSSVMTTFSQQFRTDGLLSLVQRLSHTVIKAGLKRISISYSCISFENIREKLFLNDTLTAEMVCAKAIRDGVIEAVIDHEGGFMKVFI